MEEWIVEYLHQNMEASAVNKDFHEKFHQKFGGRKKETFFGAEPVAKAQATLAAMYNKGTVIRRRIGIQNWQPGMPKWVYSYSVR